VLFMAGKNYGASLRYMGEGNEAVEVLLLVFSMKLYKACALRGVRVYGWAVVFRIDSMGKLNGNIQSNPHLRWNLMYGIRWAFERYLSSQIIGLRKCGSSQPKDN